MPLVHVDQVLHDVRHLGLAGGVLECSRPADAESDVSVVLACVRLQCVAVLILKLLQPLGLINVETVALLASAGSAINCQTVSRYLEWSGRS